MVFSYEPGCPRITGSVPHLPPNCPNKLHIHLKSLREGHNTLNG